MVMGWGGGPVERLIVSCPESGTHGVHGPVQGGGGSSSDVVIAYQFLQTTDDLIIGDGQGCDVKTQHASDDFAEVNKLKNEIKSRY